MLAVVGLVALAVAGCAAALWPRGELPKPGAGGQDDSTRLVAATLTKVARVDCEEADPGVPGSVCIKVTARLAGGRQVAFDTTDPTGGTFRAGQQVRLAVAEQPGQPPYYNIQDLERARPLLLLAALFVGAVVAFGRWQGIRSLVGLVLSFVVIVGFVVPAILRSHSPVLVAVTGAMAIMLVSLYLSHGLGPKTTAAVIGTALALGLTAALAIAFVGAASLTGLASEEALNANFAVGGLSLRGLLLAGIIIGGLGVLDDVTMSQSSLVFALRRARPSAPFTSLVRAALAVGRDHIAATVNTLFLAYAGASLPLLILFATSGDSLTSVATSEVVAVEIVRTLCGSIGLIAAVPLTTVLAAALARDETGGDEEEQPHSPPTFEERTGSLADHAPPAFPEPAAGQAGPVRRPAPAADARLAYLAARELGGEAIQRLWFLALEVFGASLAYATARAAGSAETYRLALTQPQRLEALRRRGASPDTAVYVDGDDEPVMEIATDPVERRPRLTLRLTPDEFQRVAQGLRHWGLPISSVLPRSAEERLGRRSTLP
jgi:uncharacterized membrane protein